MRNVLERLKKWAKEPDRIALVERGEKQMTFCELDMASDALGVYFSEHCKPGEPVAIWGDKENEAAVAIIAAVKSAHPYVFLPDYFPVQKVEAVASAANPAVVVAVSPKPFPKAELPLIGMADYEKIVAEYRGRTVPESAWPEGETPVCYIFTSGSTGNPKGVIIAAECIEASVRSRLTESVKALPERCRMTNMTPYAFSASFVNLFCYGMYLGSTLYGVERGLLSDFPALMKRMLLADAHVMGGTPAFMDICLKSEAFCRAKLPSVRRFGMGGEVMTSYTAKRLRERFPGAIINNVYGASETSAGGLSIAYTDEILESNGMLPSGIPNDGVEAWLEDSEGNLAKPGEPGELVIMSKLVALGYLNAPEKEAEVFFKKDGKRGFRTRDMMREENGVFYYLGRSDNLIKMGGNRIEAEEIERTLNLDANVRAAAVVPAIYEDGKVESIVAHVVPVKMPEKKIAEVIRLRKWVGEHLPPYAVPRKIVFDESLPRNSNNKIDRRKLKDMEAAILAGVSVKD